MDNFWDLLIDEGAEVYIHRAIPCSDESEHKMKIYNEFNDIAETFMFKGLKYTSGDKGTVGIQSTALRVFPKTEKSNLFNSDYFVSLDKPLHEQVAEVFKRGMPQNLRRRRIAVVLKIPKDIIREKAFTTEIDGETYIDPKFIVCVLGRTDDLDIEVPVQKIDNPRFYEYISEDSMI